MNEKVGAIEEKVDKIVQMLLELTKMVNDLTPKEARQYSDQLRKRFDYVEDKALGTLMCLLSMLPGDEVKEVMFDSEDAAKLMKRKPFTVRLKCREGLVRGIKVSGAGATGAWRISAKEVQRWLRDGDLNPPEPPESIEEGGESAAED